MYALIVPVLAPFVLLATVMGLSWWEDHVLPPPPPLTEPAAAPVEAPFTPVAPAQLPELPAVEAALTRGVAGR